MKLRAITFTILRCCLALLCLGGGNAALAHDPGLSSATARLSGNNLEITLAFSLKDAALLAPLDRDGDGTVTSEEFAAAQAAFTAALTNGFRVQLDGRPVLPAAALAWFQTKQDAYCRFVFPARAISRLAINSTLFEQLPPGHREYFELTSGTGASLAGRLLSRAENSASVEIKPETEISAATTPRERANSFVDFLMLGVEHILTGYDHLLFLFALLVVTNRFRSALKIITCFTLAHSITLALATLSSIQISSRLVEPLIAASIVYVALENLIRGNDPKGRWLLTFAFGLIHGFGFASVLRELGVGANGSGIAVPLVSFNLGVELGQIMVAAVALPVIWKLRTHPVFVRRWVPACSVAVALAGSYWFTQRVWFAG